MKISPQKIRKFREKVWRHYRHHGRDLPWRHTNNPYHILVSEIMLQQTQVDRVIPKYHAFIKQFQTPAALAQAPLQSVLSAWQGLGYNRRALALKKAAEEVVTTHAGILPTTPVELEQLPGIGPYTARAVSVFAFNQPHVLIETNIRTVFIHEFIAPRSSASWRSEVGFSPQPTIKDTEVLPLIEKTLSHRSPARWYQALMDYGTMLKKAHPNPSRRSAHYVKQSSFEGSNRQIRGLIIKLVTEHDTISEQKLSQLINKDARQVKQNIRQLAKEGFILKRGRTITINS